MFLFHRFTRTLGASRQLLLLNSSRSNWRTSSRLVLWGSGLALGTALHTQTRGIHLDAVVEGIEAENTVDVASGIEFPNKLSIGTRLNIPKLQLLGVGIRTVSFLGIQVYSVGFYADLSNPKLQFTNAMSAEDKIEHIIRNTACAVRIVPTRSTSYSHLRDAFVRAINSRLASSSKQNLITEADAQEALHPIREIKGILPNTSMAKHQPLELALTPPIAGQPRTLTFRGLGSIQNNFVAIELVLHYFSDPAPSSALKAAVVQFVEKL